MADVKLTAKQEAFAQGIADGLGQADAYRMAYDAEGMKDNTIYSKASVLMSDGKVAARVAELRAAVAERVTWTLADSLDVLSTIAKGLDADAKPSDKVNAVKAINTMIGLDAPSKLDVTGNLVTRIERVVTDDNAND